MKDSVHIEGRMNKRIFSSRWRLDLGHQLVATQSPPSPPPPPLALGAARVVWVKRQVLKLVSVTSLALPRAISSLQKSLVGESQGVTGNINSRRLNPLSVPQGYVCSRTRRSLSRDSVKQYIVHSSSIIFRADPRCHLRHHSRVEIDRETQQPKVSLVKVPDDEFRLRSQNMKEAHVGFVHTHQPSRAGRSIAGKICYCLILRGHIALK